MKTRGRNRMFALVSLIAGIGLLCGCGGANYPVALKGSQPQTSSTSSSGGSVTTGTGTGACGDGTKFQQCVNLPTNNGTYTVPLRISVSATSPNGISGWQAYANGNLITSGASSAPTSSGNTGRWDATYPSLAPGTYAIGVNTWDNTGAVIASPNINVNVIASPLPTPPTSATVYKNLQDATGSQGTWKICNGSCSGSSGTGSSKIELQATGAPSLSGGSLAETSTGAAFNTLGYLKPPCPTSGCNSVTHFIDNVWFYIPSSTTSLQALEFDPDVYDGSYEYFMSMQCDSASGDWRFWDMNDNTWTTNENVSGSNTLYPCNLLTQTNTWHHFQLYGTVNYSSHTYTYQTFVVDGKVIYQNLGNTYSAKSYSSPSPALVVEQQIDNNASATSNTVYYDDYSLTVW